MASYEIWLDDPFGSRLQVLDRLSGITYVKSVNNLGYFHVIMPGSFDDTILRRDLVVEVWRTPKGGSKSLDFCGFVRAWTLRENPDSAEFWGPGVNYVLTSRIVAYNAGSTEALKTDQADDMMKDVFNDNLLAGASDTVRDWTDNGLSVAADEADGPSLTLAFSRVNVFDVMRRIAEASAGNGTDLYFDLAPSFGSDGKLDLQFRTYTSQPGMDRRATGGNPVYFGSKWGNLVEGEYTEDYTDEITTMYSGGQGELDNRTVESASDSTRSAESPWGRREGWIDARNESSSDGVLARAYEGLTEGAGMKRFQGRLVDTEQARYGRDWNVGDRITVEFRGREFDALVRQVQVTVDGSGNEEITARVEEEL